VAQKWELNFESTPKMLKWSLTVPGNRRAAKPYSVPKIKYNAFLVVSRIPVRIYK